MTTLFACIVLAQLSPLELVVAVAQSTSSAGTVYVVVNDTGTYVSVPALPEVKSPIGYVQVSYSNGSLTFTVGSSQSCNVTLRVYDRNMSVVAERTGVALPNSPLVVGISVQNVDVVVYDTVICNETLPRAAYIIPLVVEEKLPWVSQSPLLRLAVTLLPVALILSYVLTAKTKRASLFLLASLPFIYIVVSSFTAQIVAAYMTIILALTLLIAISYYAVGQE